jgi:hypothetical protein
VLWDCLAFGKPQSSLPRDGMRRAMDQSITWQIAQTLHGQNTCVSSWDFEVPDVYSSALPLTTLGNRLAAEDVPYKECQQESLRIRSLGFEGFRSPSSAINADCCYKYAVNGGEQVAGRDSGTVYVLFGPRPDLQGSLLVF